MSLPHPHLPHRRPGEKRHVGGFFDAYLPLMGYLGLVGVIALAQRSPLVPPGAHNYVPEWLIYLWVVAFTLGGIIAFVAGLTRRTRAESSGLIFVMLGMVGYIGVVFRLYGFSWMVVESLLGVAAVFGCCVLRFRVLRFARLSERVAGTLLLEARDAVEAAEEHSDD